MSNQVHNTTESSNYNFKRISIAKFTSVLYTKSRVALDGNKLFLRQVIILYKNVVPVWLSSYNGTWDVCKTCFTLISRAVITR